MSAALRGRLRSMRSDEGASAVEFALLAPLFLLLVCVMIDFARAYNVQLTLTEAAREGVRPVALMQTSDATTTVDTAVDPDSVTVAGVSVATTPCPSGALGQSPIPNATVVVTYSYSFITPGLGSLFELASHSSSNPVGSGLSLTGKAVMRCGG